MRNKSQVVLPINLEIKISKDDEVLKVAEICESLDYTELFNSYLRHWRRVNPITMFELLVFGYMERKFSSYAIEKACRTDVRFMWLLQDEPIPSVATIKRFQSEKLKNAIEGLFYQFVEKLYEMGEVKFKNLFVDGTKIEANANKYTFVWKTAVEKFLAKTEKKLSDLIPLLAERYGFSKDTIYCYRSFGASGSRRRYRLRWTCLKNAPRVRPPRKRWGQEAVKTWSRA